MTTGLSSLTAARQVADAVLYEGYLLYPYRASSAKNQVRWQFGVLGPVGAAAAGVGEEPSMATEVVVLARAGASVDLWLRFLQVQSREVQRLVGSDWLPVDELTVGGTRWLTFHEAVSSELPLIDWPLAEPVMTRVVDIPGGEDIEALYDAGQLVGRLVRTRWPLRATVSLACRSGSEERLQVVTVEVANSTCWSTPAPSTPAPAPASAPTPATSRDEAARYSFVGTHLLMTVRGTSLVSLLDGPAWASTDTASCAQHRCWPVMIAADDGSDAVLVSPIVLGDYPAIAPESAGDLFDATEIDEILTLRVMTMTEGEKAEARGTDPRAAAILARCDSMSDDAMGRLHGARRDVDPDSDERLGPVYDDVPWWDEGQDARAEPEQDHVMVGEVAVRKGSRVRLRPSRRADAQDMFLAGRPALVTRVYFDVDGDTHVAVTLEDDPAGDLYGATGRFYYFAPDELDPLPARQVSR